MDRCSICLEDLKVDDEKKELYTLTCNHIYHKACIAEWLNDNTTCPLCRADVEPIQQYVDDNIVGEERLGQIRKEILHMREYTKCGSVGAVLIGSVLFPKHIKSGAVEKICRDVDQGVYDKSFESIENGSWWGYTVILVGLGFTLLELYLRD